MLALSTGSQTAGACVAHGTAFLIPELRDGRGLTLTQAGVVAAMPTIGIMLTLIAWGALADRYGERAVLSTGLAAATTTCLAAAASGSTIVLSGFLLLAGAAAACTNSASGRVVVGWFPPERRGLAMGIRQMAQPIGVGIAALTMPHIASAHGIGPALLLPAALAGTASLLCLTLLVDPPRPERRAAEAGGQLANPYRQGSFLVRIHAVSVLLVIPQFTVWTYALVWLTDERGWADGSAGILVAVTQVLGAAGRIGVGQLSDAVGSRVRPLRWVAMVAAASMLALALTDQLDSSAAIVLMVIATVITVADNGLAFTSVAEFSGPYWSGRALGTQNTAQYLGASIVPSVIGAAVTAFGYPAAFALSALAPIVATPLVPRADEHRQPPSPPS